MDTLVKMFTQLGVNESFTTMFLIFVVTYFAMSFVALKKLSVTIVERDNRIAGREKEAHKLKTELSEITAKLNEHLVAARKKSNEIFQSLKNRAITEQKAILTASRETAAVEIKGVRDQVQSQIRSEFAKLEKEIPAISKMMLDQIVLVTGHEAGNKGSGPQNFKGV